MHSRYEFPALSLSCACVPVKSLPTLCDPMDSSLPGSSVHGILQARITAEACHSLLQGFFPTHRWNPCLLASCIGRWFLYHLGSPFKSLIDSLMLCKNTSSLRSFIGKTFCQVQVSNKFQTIPVNWVRNLNS